MNRELEVVDHAKSIVGVMSPQSFVGPITEMELNSNHILGGFHEVDLDTRLRDIKMVNVRRIYSA